MWSDQNLTLTLTTISAVYIFDTRPANPLNTLFWCSWNWLYIYDSGASKHWTRLLYAGRILPCLMSCQFCLWFLNQHVGTEVARGNLRIENQSATDKVNLSLLFIIYLLSSIQCTTYICWHLTKQLRDICKINGIIWEFFPNVLLGTLRSNLCFFLVILGWF